jgi:hypothetical protein
VKQPFSIPSWLACLALSLPWAICGIIKIIQLGETKRIVLFKTAVFDISAHILLILLSMNSMKLPYIIGEIVSSQSDFELFLV